MEQLALSFEPGLAARFPELEDVLVAAVYGSKEGLKGVAAELDLSPSDLSKRLSRESEQRPVRCADLVGILAATGDMRPIYWLIEKFLRDPEAMRNQAISQLAQLLPTLTALVEQSADGRKRR